MESFCSTYLHNMYNTHTIYDVSTREEYLLFKNNFLVEYFFPKITMLILLMQQTLLLMQVESTDNYSLCHC